MTELGNKHECLSCSTKFYDLGKSELICPKCGADQKELAESGEGAEAKKKAKTKKKSKKKAKTTKKAKTEEAKTDSEPGGEDEKK